MPFSYRHTQIGHLLRIASIAPASGLVVVGLVLDRAFLLCALAALLTFIGWSFSSLTIEVEQGSLTWFFGAGLWRKTVPLSDIVSATPVKNPWWYGWGIHRTPRGWLYNVDGADAVEIALRSERTFRLGTDEPDLLARAVVAP